MTDIFEIIVYGRGGQGVKTCAQIIAESAAKDGKIIQAFPEYGPERRGAPVKAFVRISDKKIRKHTPITNPNLVIIVDSSLLDTMPELSKFNCDYIINSGKTTFSKSVSSKKTYIINASKIAIENLKTNNPNIVLIGAFLKLFKQISLNTVSKAIEEEFKKKGKLGMIGPNVKCLMAGWNYFG